MRVRYEDLLEDPSSVMDQVLHFTGIHNPNIDTVIKEHLQSDTMLTSDELSYKEKLHIADHMKGARSTYRPSDFTADHKWKCLPYTQLRSIEDQCQEVMKILKYPSYKPNPRDKQNCDTKETKGKTTLTTKNDQNE